MLQHLENVEERLDLDRDVRLPVDLKQLFAARLTAGASAWTLGSARCRIPRSPRPRYRLRALAQMRARLPRDMRKCAAQVMAQTVRLAADMRMQRNRAHQRRALRLLQHLVELVDDQDRRNARPSCGAPRSRWRRLPPADTAPTATVRRASRARPAGRRGTSRARSGSPTSFSRSGVTSLSEIHGPSQPRGGLPSCLAISAVASAISLRSSVSGNCPWRSALVRPCAAISHPASRNAAISSGTEFVDARIDQHGERQFERAAKLKNAPRSDAVAVVEPGIVQHVRGGRERHELIEHALAEP